MSEVKDSQGNVLNRNLLREKGYTGEHTDTLDWFDLHPEAKPLVTEADLPAASKFAEVVVAANGQDSPELRKAREEYLDGLIANAGTSQALPSGADLDAVAAEQKVVDATAGATAGAESEKSEESTAPSAEVVEAPKE